MLSHTNTVSLAGTWGDKKVNELQRGNSNNNTNSAFYNTTYSTNFTEKDMKSDVTPELLPSKSIAKFRTLQRSGKSILNYDNSRDEEFVTTTTVREITDDVMPDPYNARGQKKFDRTYSKILRTEEAPVALGRSGLRIEKGLNASGLIGERLLNSPDNPANNTFAQKAWQPCDNPALEVVKKGRPVAGRPSDVSLAIGEMLQPDGQALIPVPIEGTSTYGRKYLITGDILSKSVSSKNPSRVFMDDE